MDALRKQASKFREQVAKQQQAVIKQFSASGYESSDVMVIDEVEMQRHHQLEKLYRSTRTGRDIYPGMLSELQRKIVVYKIVHLNLLHCSIENILIIKKKEDEAPCEQDFQKEVVKAAETFTAIGYKHIEAGTKLSEDCAKYGIENAHDETLAKVASIYGDARKHIEKEQEDFNKLLFSEYLGIDQVMDTLSIEEKSLEKYNFEKQKVLEPLRAMISGSPLEDARHLAQRYSRMRQEAEAQAVEVSRRQARVREAPIPENVAKLHAAESRMQELKANMTVLGKEATAALSSVESQQQRHTFQRLVAMVEGERTYHERVAAILGQIETEMVSDKQRKEAAPPAIPPGCSPETTKYFLAEVIHGFVGESEKELSLDVGDYVVVRKVSPSGWSEGECRGKAGWFPSEYVEKRQRIPTINGAAEV